MLGFTDGRSTVGSDAKGRDDSPDSVITQAANFSLFSSATASIGRSSFESDGEDRESMVSDRSKSLAGRDYKDISRAPDLEVISKSRTKDARNKQKARTEEDVDPTTYSFSTAVEECHKRRLRPEKKRTTSLDLNNAGDAYASSPRLATMTMQHQQKISAARKSGTGSALASPGTPPLRSGLAQQRGCSSERVPLVHNCVRRHVTASQIYPGKSLPSKWEDAEKWIFSPVSNDAPNRPVLPPRKPKSKSGPLALIGSGFPQAVPVPCTARVAPSNSFQFSREDGHVGVGLGQAASSNPEECMLRSASVHGWSDLVIQAPESPESLPVCSNVKPDGAKDAATMISPVVSKRDMATQMSPEASSTVSSPRERDSSPSSPRPPLTIMELQRIHRLSKLEIRDVELDDRITMTRRSKRLVDRISLEVGDWKKKTMDAHTSAWEVAETAKCVSKSKREEAKIAAWENLQKAKAEAEIRKLEVKLEKLRSSSMEKIMNKLRAAQKKANAMRISVKAMHAQRAAKTAERAAIFRRTGHMGALSGCFTCHAAEC
ncbi:uncharacterized protein LOC116259447 isoform X1 [Nymphaea colorata]|nr:uncharacterized protein LOC116259447 isoform X1 [Nymphaea colorata]